MSTERVEVAENEVEVADGQTLAVSDIASTDGMDAIIAVGAKMEAFTKAMDTILNAVIKRSYVGDWVCHAKADTKPEDRKANIGSAAAERIATFLGIQEKNWTPGEKIKSDDGKHFTWIFEADFGFGKRWIHAIGRASSQDKFFGYANGEWKALEDVKEDDIRMAAFRSCRKEGVRGLLGLRGIPLSKLTELGYPADRIKMVNFTEKMSDADKKAVDDKGLIWKVVKIASVTKKSESKDPKKPWTLWNVSDGKLTYSMFANGDSSRLHVLEMRQEDQLPVKIGVKLGTYNNQEQYSIEKVEGEEAKS
jgi:hypothetical protein